MLRCKGVGAVLVKAIVRGSSLREAEDLAARALSLGSELEIERLVLGVMADRFGAEIEGLPIAADTPEPARAEPTGT